MKTWDAISRLNAIRLEEKEKREKELLVEIIEEAEQYKIEFYRKHSVSVENSKSSNREREKVMNSCKFPFFQQTL